MEIRSSEFGVGGKGPVQTFEDLIVWQEAQNLAVEIYKATNSFPKEEVFGITSQIRRSSSSISANIAEGFGRPSINDKLHFMSIAYGSLLEVKNFIYLASKLEYLQDDTSDQLLSQVIRCQKLINGFKRSLKNGQ